MGPLLFEPYLRPMVWGGRRLEEKLGKTLPDSQTYGESWEVSDHPKHHSVVANPSFAGKTLRQLMDQHPGLLLGAAANFPKQFPWLIKFLDAYDWLSVQVHPDETAVKTLLPGEGSKTEAWFILDVEPGSRIYSGLKPGVNQSKLKEALQQGNVADCLHSFVPQPGDCVFLPAGTVHAVGGGVLMAEIQQTSDATFRLFDWNRKDAQGKSRELHIEQAFAAIHWDQGPVTPVRVEGYELTNSPKRQQLAECPYFQMEFVQEQQPISFGGQNKLQALIIARGKGRMEYRGSPEEVMTGQVWILPADCDAFSCIPEPSLGLVVCSLP